MSPHARPRHTSLGVAIVLACVSSASGASEESSGSHSAGVTAVCQGDAAKAQSSFAMAAWESAASGHAEAAVSSMFTDATSVSRPCRCE